MKIGDYPLKFNCSGSQEQFRWYEAGPLWLDGGETSISVSAQGKILFDEMVLYSLKEDEDGSVLQNLFSSNSDSPTIQYQVIGTTSYRVHVKTSQPFFMLFSETYNSLWKARFDDGQEIEPVIAYSLINAFYVNRTGEFDIVVYFAGQMLADFGLRLSLSSLIVVIIILVTPKSVVVFLRKRFNLRGRKLWRSKTQKR
jgi:hypothetical protein